MERQQRGNPVSCTGLALYQATTDTRIFSRVTERLRLYISMIYGGARYSICTTVHNDAQLFHANIPPG